MKINHTNIPKTLILVILASSIVFGCKGRGQQEVKEKEKGISATEETAGYSFKEHPDVVATVNGTEIPRKDLERIFAVLSTQSKMTGQGKSDEELAGYALDELINAELLKQESARHNFTPSPEVADKEFEMLKVKFPDSESFEKALSEKGITVDEVKKNIKEQLAVKKLLEKEIEEKIKISKDEIRTFYDENNAYFKQEESVNASHILVKTEEGDDESKISEARKKIEEILLKSKKGEDFSELARIHSEGPSAQNGGDLGYFTRGQMVKPFEDKAFSLKTGEISGIVKTEFGFHIIKVIDKKPAGITPLKEAEESIRSYLATQAGEKLFREYVEQLRSGAIILRNI